MKTTDNSKNPVMRYKILSVLLIMSILGNIYFGFLLTRPMQNDLSDLQNKTNDLEEANADLKNQVYQDNITMRNYISQIEVYRQRVAYPSKQFEQYSNKPARIRRTTGTCGNAED